MEGLTIVEKYSIYSNISSIIMLLVAVISAFVAFLSLRYHKKQAQKNKACELAKYYIDNILPKVSLVSFVFNNTTLGEFAKSHFKAHEIKDFDMDELQLLLGTCSLAETEKEFNMIDPYVLVSFKLNCAKDNTERCSILSDYEFILSKGSYKEISEAHTEALASLEKGYLMNEFKRIITTLLNELEWFSMNFTYKLADEKVVYQSLHQTFTSNVQLLYYYISKLNKNACSKYYTNLIQLYNEWYECISDQQKALRKNKIKTNTLLRKGKPI